MISECRPTSTRILIDERPHIAFVFTQIWRRILLALVLWAMFRWFGAIWNQAIMIQASWVVLGAIFVMILLRLADWLGRRHILTDSMISSHSGIFRQVVVELPLRRVQHTILVRPFGERLLGLGSIGVTTAGTGGVELVWRGVEHPQRVLDTIKAHVERMSEHGAGKSVTPIIGIVGGIGSGKSTVAAVFQSLGCVVSDSDAAVRDLLSEPTVIGQLRDWWGEKVFSPDGRIDRSKVAQIVFETPSERRRLEGFIHPLVHQRRRDTIWDARQSGAAGVIVDAPLLFEAGVDSECDAIVFVDTPREIRLLRVQESRGWDAEELDRRENTQLGLEEKRKRSDYVVANTGLPDELHGRVVRVLAAIQKDLRDRQPLD